MTSPQINLEIREATNLNYDNFDSDLNACHEMEKVLTSKQMSDYMDNLEMTTKADYEIVSMVRATAAQRSEAFLRVLGKWQEAEEEPEPEADRPLRLDADRIEYEERRASEANEAP